MRTLTPIDAERFKQRASTHLRRWAWAYALLAATLLLLQQCFTLGINTSPSLPHRLYVIHKHSLPAKGELVAIRWQGGGPYRPGATFVKILAGIPGDTVTRIDRDFFVNGLPVGTAKQKTRIGVPLNLGPEGTLPRGHYYVRAPHPDSLDSRYALTGWIAQPQIIGRAYAIF
jgi:conjugal transfer pilin signal peptidase TrbI